MFKIQKIYSKNKALVYANDYSLLTCFEDGILPGLSDKDFDIEIDINKDLVWGKNIFHSDDSSLIFQYNGDINTFNGKIISQLDEELYVLDLQILTIMLEVRKMPNRVTYVRFMVSETETAAYPVFF